MALTEQQRAEIYSNIAGTIGEKEAEFLMAQQPPGGWEQFATKRDLADLETKTQAGFVGLNAKMDVQFAQLREQLAEQFAEIQKQFAQIDGRFAAIDGRFAPRSTPGSRRFDGRFADRRNSGVWVFAVATVSICGSIFLAAWQFAPA